MQPIVKINEFIESHAEDKTQAQAMKLSVIGTGIAWLLILLFLAISPMFKKPAHYNTISITLEPLQEQKASKAEKTNPALTKTENALANEAAAPKKEEKREQQKKASEPQKTVETKKPETAKKVEKTEKPAAKTAPQPQKTEPVKQKAEKTPASAAAKSNANASAESKSSAPKSDSAATQTKSVEQPKKAVIKYKKSLDELLEEQQNSSASSEKKWDDSMFNESSAVTNESTYEASKNAKAVNGASALSGKAAVASTGEIGTVIAKSDLNSSKSTAATSATSDMLTKITAATYSMSAGNGLSSTSNVKVAKSTDGKVALALSDGSARVLLDPVKPVILISEENAQLIDSTRQVVITFKILAQGNVPFSGISFAPAAALPLEIQSEIKEQVSKWRFAPASSDGQAKFDYSIIKK